VLGRGLRTRLRAKDGQIVKIEHPVHAQKSVSNSKN